MNWFRGRLREFTRDQMWLMRHRPDRVGWREVTAEEVMGYFVVYEFTVRNFIANDLTRELAS